jgi:phosphonate transport system substrate-binding protein
MRSFINRTGLFLAALCLWPLAAVADYTLSITPRFSPDVSIKRVTPLADLLGSVLGQPVKINLSPTFDDLEQRMRSGQIDIAFITPTQYPFVSGTMEPVAIIADATDGAKLRGLVITRADSLIHSQNDLKGRSAAIVSEKSAGGYLSQKVALDAINVDTTKDMRLQVVADNKQENVVMSVYLGEADVGFVREDALHVADKYVPPSQIRVVMLGAWLPNWCIVVKRSLVPQAKNQVRAALLGLKADAPTLKALQATAFVPGADADFDVYRKALNVPIPTR